MNRKINEVVKTHQYRRNQVFPTIYWCCFQPYFCLCGVETDWRSISIDCLCSSSACYCLLLFSFWAGFLSLCLPSFLSPHFLPLASLPWLSAFGRLSPSAAGPEARGSGAKLWRRVLFVEAGKATASRFRLFSLKLAVGVAYLTRTEIPVVERQGVALITSAAAVSFRLIERMSRIPFGSRTQNLCFSLEKWSLVSFCHVYAAHRGWRGFSLNGDNSETLIIDVDGRENTFPQGLCE